MAEPRDLTLRATDIISPDQKVGPVCVHCRAYNRGDTSVHHFPTRARTLKREEGRERIDDERAFLLYVAGCGCYSQRSGRYSLKGGVKMDASEPRVRRRGFFL